MIPKRSSSRNTAWLYSGQLALLVLLYFGALTNIVLLSIGLGPSSAPGAGPTLAYFSDILLSAGVRTAFANSFKLAAVTALIAVPLAFASARCALALRSPFLRALTCGIVMIPLLSSSVLRMLGFSILLSGSGPFGWWSCGAVLSVSCGGILYSPSAIIVGLVASVFPVCFMILFIQLLRIPAEQIMAARNLGASAWEIWWRIEVPRSASALLLSVQVCFIFVLGDMLARSILGGNSVYTYTAAINDRMKIDAWSEAAAMALLLVLVVCSIVALIVWRMQRAGVTRPQRLAHGHKR